MENREDFYYDDSDNLESDDTMEKEEGKIHAEVISTGIEFTLAR